MSVRKYIIPSVIGLVIITVSFLAIFQNIKKRDYNEALRVTQEWANLTQFPGTAKIISIEKHGTAVTSEFVVIFTAPDKDIRYWIETSPGMKDVTPLVEGDVEIYTIKPTAGAQFAEVRYNIRLNEIIVRVYWS